MKAMSGILYALRRHHVGAFSLLHWVSLFSLGGAALMATERFDMHRLWSGPLLLLAVALPVADYLAARRGYVSFTPGPHMPEATRLSPQTHVAVRATGLFEVEGKFRRHTWLEASYRTFPSREHAVIATCPPSRLLWAGRSRREDQGMWYIFCLPQAIRNVHVGYVQFGRQRRPAVALTHNMEVPGRFRRKRVRHEDTVIYLGCAHTADALVIAGDLNAETPSRQKSCHGKSVMP